MSVSVLDMIVDALNTIDGIEFAKDAWENKAPENYGVVELKSQNAALWADGHMVEQSYSARVTIYVIGGEDEWLKKVQDVLDGADVPYRFPERAFLFDIGKVSWVWDITLYGLLTRVVDDGETGDND